LRHLYLRYGEGTDQLMVCLVLNGKHLPDARPFIDALTAAFPQTVSVMLNFNTKNTNVVLGEEYRLLHGTPYIEDVLCGKTFRISPQSFYQVNHDGAQLLYSLAAERTGMNGQGTLLDLYCGIGSIGLSMAERAERLVGIEIVESAVQCARENAARNGVSNAVFSCGDASDAEKLLDAAEREYGKIDADVVILDPPRKGSTPELRTYLSDIDCKRIVYISCNPDTLARDAKLLCELGYSMGDVYIYDMFPKTGHVESVVCLERSHK
jgi:23S rRNA (uracil1939-C5)-methyltransferase